MVVPAAMVMGSFTVNCCQAVSVPLTTNCPPPDAVGIPELELLQRSRARWTARPMLQQNSAPQASAAVPRRSHGESASTRELAVVLQELRPELIAAAQSAHVEHGVADVARGHVRSHARRLAGSR